MIREPSLNEDRYLVIDDSDENATEILFVALDGLRHLICEDAE